MRISREQMYMEVAGVAAKRSTCFRASVGAVVVHEKNIVAIGYNGPGPGEEHCTGHTCPGAESGCSRAIHAERNALARIPQTLTGALELYLTHSPCDNCANRIQFFGRPTFCFQKIYFRELYRVNDHLDSFNNHGIALYQMTPSGFIINYWTKELV